MCHGLAETRANTIQDDIDEVVICHLGLDIESLDVIQVFLDSTCLLEITDLIESPICLIKVVIVFPNSVLYLFLAIDSMLIRFQPFQRIPFRTQANMS